MRLVLKHGPETRDREARRLLGPGYILDDDAEEWAAVIVTYGGQTGMASSVLPVAKVARLGLDKTGRMIDRAAIE